nr:hypothetical protein [Rhodococcus globerulus]
MSVIFGLGVVTKVRKAAFISTVPKSAAGKILRKDLRTAEAAQS